jgi:hypothetical protein
MKTAIIKSSGQLNPGHALLPLGTELTDGKQPLAIWVGHRMTEVLPEEAGEDVCLSSDDLGRLGIPSDRLLRRHSQANRMCFGPFMGILSE